MLCDACGKESAIVPFVQVVNQKVTTLNLCAKCAEKKGIFAQPFSKLFFSMGDLLASMLKELNAAEPKEEGPSIVCSHCGLSFAEFRTQGRLGCSHCYLSFEKELKPLLRRIHGSTTHTGKAASSFDQSVWKKREVKKLRDEMQRAIDREDFESAATLRDRIRSLEEKLAP